MYNIAKVAKGEVLPYFNDIFDALCKVSDVLILVYWVLYLYFFSLEQIPNSPSKTERNFWIV
jgi:hypothetical protein